MIARALVILFLVAAILGGTAYFAYELYLKPKKLDVEEKKMAEIAPPTPPPDPSLSAFEKLRPVLELDTTEAQSAISAFLESYPESPVAPAARAALGRINAAQILSPSPSPDKTAYSVARGDSLVKIAAKFKTNAELIFRVNALQTINLQIGQELVIPKLDVSLVVDRAAMTVTLQNAGVFVREYPVKSLKLPASASTGTVQTKVGDKLAMKGNARVAFGTKDYEGSDRWVMLGLPGLVLRGTPPPAADGSEVPMPPGIVLDPADASEIYVLTARGTPVTIR
ncbi:MAG: LysM peptidoglycan-binding domain-containing protein [Terrimicrobiaceae bacterium]|nr:LysM peptidoglycan-binding domain-containing protein [Terrimicrobiaceae bacterium]